MSRRRARLGAAIVVALLMGAPPVRAQPPEPSAAEILAQVRAATGGERWDRVASLSAVGEKSSFGLKGPYASTENLLTGQFARRSDYGVLANGEGRDAAGRWRMDNSGFVHALNSDEARTVAVAESWLAARGYLFPQRAPAELALLAPATEGSEVFDRVAATPPGGRAVTLWVRRSDHRLARATIELDSRLQTLRYSDYRPVSGLMLPFDIATENTDQLEVGDARIAGWTVSEAAPGEALRRPVNSPGDAAIRGDGPAARTPLRLDPATGFALVEARINGAAPMLFILDTGGHDILTPAAAKALGLDLHGAGFSFGAGSGSTPTQFTRAARVALGEAEMADQPFIVLQLDLGQAMGPDKAMTPIAGIIGLELFERFTVTLDYPAGQVALRRPAAEPIAGGVPIRFTSDMPLAEASVDGRGGWFGLDTGNNVGVILYKAWVEARGLPDWFAVAVDVPGNGVGGPVTFRRGHAGQISLAGVTQSSPRVLLADDHMGALSSRAEAGNIGESVLSHYVVTFDYAHERVRLDAPRTQASPAGP